MVKRRETTGTEDERLQLIRELYKPTRNTFKRRKVEIRGLSDLIEFDIGDLSKLKTRARGFKYILIAVNPFSKMIYTRALKTKTARETAMAAKSILDETNLSFKNCFTDSGGEFMGLPFQNLMKSLNINHYTSRSVKKAPHSERYLGTLKRRLYKEMEFRGHFNWPTMLEKVTNEINNTPHSRLRIIPAKISPKDINFLKNHYAKKRPFKKKTKFKIGDNVRISQNPKLFKRGFKPYWSNELYKIKKINFKLPHTYLLVDYKNQLLDKAFYQEELQATRVPHIKIIDRVISRLKNKKCKVRWAGYDKSYDSIIKCNEISRGIDNKTRSKK